MYTRCLWTRVSTRQRQSRQELPGPLHVRQILVTKPLNQLGFLRSGSDHNQHTAQPSRHGQTPIGTHQTYSHSKQERCTIERVTDPSIGALVTKVCSARVTTVSVRFLPRLLSAHEISITKTGNIPTPIHRSQMGSGIENHEIHAAFMSHAKRPIHPSRPHSLRREKPKLLNPWDSHMVDGFRSLSSVLVLDLASPSSIPRPA